MELCASLLDVLLRLLDVSLQGLDRLANLRDEAGWRRHDDSSGVEEGGKQDGRVVSRGRKSGTMFAEAPVAAQMTALEGKLGALRR